MKKTKGISLIVLVITIIVMIIIAGAIILSLSNTNVIDQAETAVQKHNEASEKDMLTLAWGEYMASSIRNPDTELKVEGATVTGNSTNGWTVTFTSGSKYTVSSKGQITKDGEQEEIEVNDERIAELLVAYSDDWANRKNQVVELKKELDLEHVEGEELYSIANEFAIFDDQGEHLYIYFFERDRIYEYKDIGNNDKECIFVVNHVSRDDAPNAYSYAEKINKIRTELKSTFVGKNVTEIEQKFNNGTLKQYILDNCTSLKDINIDEDDIDRHEYEGFYEQIIIRDMTFMLNDEEHFCDYNTFYFVSDVNGIYTDVYIMAGN